MMGDTIGPGSFLRVLRAFVVNKTHLSVSSAQHKRSWKRERETRDLSRREVGLSKDYFLRWRILARMRRFLRPCFRRPFPDFLVPKASSVCNFCDCRQSTVNHDSSVI